MSANVIQVESLSKRYVLSHEGSGMGGRFFRYQRFSDTLIRAVQAPFRLLKKNRAPDPTREEFWALKDVSFEVKGGEVVGIIGRNGAGKSTLLKILSRITEPTKGRVEIEGRVASLLEVGTGFHSELTGRENIYLNGTILGMTRREIKRKFDEIVAFAEVEKFLDTPVKHYSSGMYVRLAFAVAAHLEPDILIVDEVLAVGDAQFQKKCLGKMHDVSQKEGRTVLFVSHNLASIRSLCSRGVLLNKGCLEEIGNVDSVIDRYVTGHHVSLATTYPGNAARPSIVGIKLHEDELANGDLLVDISYESPFPLHSVKPGIVISSKSDVPLFGSNPKIHPRGFTPKASLRGCLRITVRRLPLYAGMYNLSVWLGDGTQDYDQKMDALHFEFKTGQANSPITPDVIGPLDLPAEWTVLE